MTLALIRKLAPFVIVALLVGFILFQRNSITAANARLAAKTEEAKNLTAANKNAADTIAKFSQQRIDNDAIATAVASKIKVTNTREVTYQNTIEKANADDPQVSDWRSVAVPARVRSALSTNQPDAATR